jgi:signal transduction histidine kinase
VPDRVAAPQELSSDRFTFRPRSRLLQLLGDELIASPRLAVFELIKNAYDGCARRATVTLGGLDGEDPWIEVRDDGDGMTLETIRDIWLVPGNDHRKVARHEGLRSHCGRLPLGEKGVGRFAVHKLGDRVKLVTRSAENPECTVDIHWAELIGGAEYLSDAAVEVVTRRPQEFQGASTGTIIEIHDLRERDWRRGEIRRLHRQITSICSPFETPSGFSVELKVPGRQHELEGIPEVSELVERAFWHFAFSFDGESYSWNYEFRPAGLKLEGRVASSSGDPLLLPKALPSGETATKGHSRIAANIAAIDGIGPVRGEFHVYDRDKEVLRRLPETRLLEDFLDQQGGIRVYRDGMRVYNYGEPGDDWLGLDLRRVNRPTRTLSRNLILGAVHLSLDRSDGLVERTSREGFVESDALVRLKQIVLGVLATLERERLPDKQRIRLLLGKEQAGWRSGIREPIAALKRELQKAKVYGQVERQVLAVEHQYEEMQENLLRPAVSGLNLAVVFHEVERGVKELLASVRRREATELLERQTGDLVQLLEGFSYLLKQGEKKLQPIGRVVDRVRQINSHRFRAHRVALNFDLSLESNPGFSAPFSFGLVLGALNNLIDNAIYWLQVRWPEEPPNWETSPRRICIRESRDIEGGPCLIVADTGPGLQDDPADLIRPFYTRRPDGMGLGLYFASMVMELMGGRLLFPDRGDIDLPQGFDGAVVGLQFQEPK